MAEEINVKKKKAEALRFLGKGKIDKAIEVYEQILAAKEDPDIYNAVGDLYVRKQNISKAIESYEKSYKLYKEVEFLDNAVAVIRKILKYEKDRKDLYLELAGLYTELGNQDSALDALESVITDDLDPSMLERAFSIISQLAEKVQEDESSVRRFERLFVKLQEISERFGEISLESGMGMDMGVDEESLFAPEATEGAPEEVEEEEGILLDEGGEPDTQEVSESYQEEQGQANVEEEELETHETSEPREGGEEFVFEEEPETPEEKEEESIQTVSGLSKGYKDLYNPPEAEEEAEVDEELVFEEEESEVEPVIDERETQEVSLVEEASNEEFKEEVPIAEPENVAEPETQEVAEEVQEAKGEDVAVEKVVEEDREEERVGERVESTIPSATVPTEEIISRKPVEREKPPTTHRPSVESKYAEEFKDIVLTFIEELSEADIFELYDFKHAFETAMTLYKMDLYDAAIEEFQRAMRDSESRLKAMEMIGRIFYEIGNYEMSIKMLEKALDEGGYEEHEYVGVRYFLAKSYEAMGFEDKSLEVYEQLYLIDRTYRDVGERIDTLKLKRMKSL